MSNVSDTPAYRYSAQLAESIESRWQAYWEAEKTFEAPNPAGPLADAERLADRRKLFVLDMFPYPSGTGLHVGHPLGYIGTDVFGRFRRMKGDNVLHCDRLRRVRPARRAVRHRHRHASAGAHRGEHRHHAASAAPAGAGSRPAPFGGHHRRGLLPLDPVDLPADLQLLVRHRPRQGAARSPS